MTVACEETVVMRTRREGGVKGIPKADRTWISGTREKESNGAGGWRFISLDGESVGRKVWDVCLRCTEITLKATGTDKVACGDREVGRGVCPRVTLSSDSL